MAQSSAEHCKVLLSAIIPARRDLLDVALRHLSPSHFTDPVLRTVFLMLEKYADITGSVLTQRALEDLLSRGGSDPGKVALYTETYALLTSTSVPDADFRWSLEQVRELAADRATSEALTQSMEILSKGAQSDSGKPLRGHADARSHLLQAFADIDRELSMQDAPEGDMRQEGDQILEDYALRKKLRLQGKSPGILFGIPELDAKLGGLQPGELVLMAGYTSDGKSQPLDALVLTPDRGYVPMGAIKVGDAVVDPKGSLSQVSGVFPQGVLPVYRLTFADGSQVEASGDHLWEVSTWKNRKDRGHQRQVLMEEVWTTDQIRLRSLSKSRNPSLVEVPAMKDLDLGDSPTGLDPYLLGLLLGDGSLVGGVTFCSADRPLIDAVQNLIPDSDKLTSTPGVGRRLDQYWVVKSGGRSRYGKSSTWQALVQLGLAGLRSWEKFVPSSYKLAPAKDRLALLQGLMDTDGWRESGACFSSASRQLRDDVVFLARSLGLFASVSEKETSYTYLGEKRSGRQAFTARIHETLDVRVFRLERKIKRIRDRGVLRSVVSVEYVGDKECQCISVSAPSKLYVTNDFIPTHNTSLCVQLAHHAAVRQGKNVVILTTETLREQVRRKLLSRHSRESFFELAEGINTRDLKNGTLSPHQEEKLQDVVADLTRNPSYGKCYIAQVPRGATMGSCEARLLRLNRSFPIDLVVMDYLQLLRADRRRDSDREEQGGIVNEAKQVAVTLDDGRGVPFVSPWQVNRTKRDEALRTGSYSTAALSETATASNTADLIISALAAEEKEPRYNDVKIQVLKNRDGETASSIPVTVDYATSHFTSTRRAGSMDDLLGSSSDPLSSFA